jgi:hypothetical protein
VLGDCEGNALGAMLAATVEGDVLGASDRLALGACVVGISEGEVPGATVRWLRRICRAMWNGARQPRNPVERKQRGDTR